MSINFHSMFTPCDLVDVKQFESDMKNYLQFRTRVNTADIFLIHNPRISNLVNTSIDLLLIIAIENKQGNYYIVEKENADKAHYFKNLIIPIQFVDHYKNSKIVISQQKLDDYNYNTEVVIDEEDVEINIEDETKYIEWKTLAYLKNLFNTIEENKIGTLFIEPIVWFMQKDCVYNFTKINVILAPKFGFEELKAYFKYSDIQFFNNVNA